MSLNSINYNGKWYNLGPETVNDPDKCSTTQILNKEGVGKLVTGSTSELRSKGIFRLCFGSYLTNFYGTQYSFGLSSQSKPQYMHVEVDHPRSQVLYESLVVKCYDNKTQQEIVPEVVHQGTYYFETLPLTMRVEITSEYNGEKLSYTEVIQFYVPVYQAAINAGATPSASDFLPCHEDFENKKAGNVRWIRPELNWKSICDMLYHGKGPDAYEKAMALAVPTICGTPTKFFSIYGDDITNYVFKLANPVTLFTTDYTCESTGDFFGADPLECNIFYTKQTLKSINLAFHPDFAYDELRDWNVNTFGNILFR